MPKSKENTDKKTEKKLGYLETEIDELLKIVQKHKKLKLSDAAQILNIHEDIVENWGNILEKHQLIRMHYPIIGEPTLEIMQEKISRKEMFEKKKEEKRQKKLEEKRRKEDEKRLKKIEQQKKENEKNRDEKKEKDEENRRKQKEEETKKRKEEEKHREERRKKLEKERIEERKRIEERAEQKRIDQKKSEKSKVTPKIVETRVKEDKKTKNNKKNKPEGLKKYYLPLKIAIPLFIFLVFMMILYTMTFTDYAYVPQIFFENIRYFFISTASQMGNLSVFENFYLILLVTILIIQIIIIVVLFKKFKNHGRKK